MILPRKDAYGPEADRSNIADYMEMLALKGRTLTVDGLADFLLDREWNVRSRELYELEWDDDHGASRDDSDGGADVSPEELLAADIFEFVARRVDLLNDLYPFVLTESGLRVRDSLSIEHEAYLALLAITVAHHYGLSTADKPERVFESIVAQAMTGRGLLTADTGTAARGKGNFAELVQQVGEDLALVASPGAAPFRVSANEEGVDTISHLSWGDTRSGHWLFIGQATCSRSNEWNRKICEPKAAQWPALVTSAVKALAYLAVPHHVEDEQMEYLTRNHQRLVLDRMRLCRHLGPLSDQQRALMSAVQLVDVYDPGAE